ncbi:potassium channel family protein [Thermococcus sibiricus]|uniref:Calcium-gated potassium channel protein n=1 Tax=Thermococcus sibiricus (strain DSM 12597 / MM 739) TaxID=604354 RepID=C6A059_THESM|nr:NAD-binding protein [Thermococcus sibiricus]ACS91040.1 Calcium-gated potassium channel protein [Thermococcus sibiricus MM 739]
MIPLPLVRKLLKLQFKLKRSKLFALALAVVLLALVLALLYMYAENVGFFTALYWAVITMATIGYGDITPSTLLGRIIAIFASIAGIATFTAFVSILAEYFLSGSIRRMMGMHKVKFKGHYVIMGRGESIESALLELRDAISNGQAENKPIIVVLPDENERKKLTLAEEIEIIIGEFTNKETLERANIKDASYVLLALGDDSESVFVTLMIKQLSNAKVFVEALKHESVSLLKQAGADRVITSRTLAGRLLASSIFEPEVVDVLDDITTALGRYDITSMRIPEVEGMKFGEAFNILYNRGLFLIGYATDEIHLMPPLDTIIPNNAKLLVIKSTM